MKWLLVIPGVACAFVLALAAAMFACADPLADDFARAAVPWTDLGATLGDFYQTWYGRWLALVVAIGAMNLVDPTRAYAALLLPVAAITVAAAYALARVLLPHASPRMRCAGALLFLTLLWSGMPEPAWAFTWFCGAIEYQLGIACGVLLVCACLRPARPNTAGTGRAGGARLAVWFACAFALPGLHELYGMMLAATLIAGALLARTLGIDARRWLAAAAGAIAGSALVLLAPGNLARSHALPHSMDLSRAFARLKQEIHENVVPWACDAPLLALSALFVVYVALQSPHTVHDARSAAGLRVLRILVPSCTLVFVLAALFVPALGMGTRAPVRAWNSAYFVFLIGWFASLFVWTRFDGHQPIARGPRRLLVSAAFAVFALAVVFSDNATHAWRDLQDRLPQRHAARALRHEQARQAVRNGSLDLVVAPLPRAPRSAEPTDIGASPHAWENQAFAAFFGLRSVRVAERSDGK